MLCKRVILAAVLGIVNCADRFPSEATPGQDFQVRLTADVADVDVEFGLVVNHANTIERDEAFRPPPGNYTRGAMIMGMFNSLEIDGAYEVYVANSTGNIPIQNQYTSRGPGVCLFRWFTKDFQNYTGGECTLWVYKTGQGYLKSMTRDDQSGKYFMLYWGPVADANNGSPYMYTSTTSGRSWDGPHLVQGLDHYNPPGTTITTKDDLNMVWQPGIGLVDLQLFWQDNITIPGGLCDNGGCNKRRMLGTMVSNNVDGLIWNFTGSTRNPGEDVNDPPELQFYRSRPFVVPGTGGSRIFAHTLLYSPSPYINAKYGMHGPEGESPCKDPPHEKWCHAPHMYEEWWTLASGANAADISNKSWRRPARFTKMAPQNAYLFAQPGQVGTGESMKMVWVGSGEVYTLPLHRGVGLWAPANTRVKVPAFNLSAASATTKLWINADAHWGPPLPQGGCDETCAAYVLVELEDMNKNVIPGYDHEHFNVIMAENGINLPLRWNNSTKLPSEYGEVTVKIWFRAAKIYAVYLGESFEPTSRWKPVGRTITSDSKLI